MEYAHEMIRPNEDIPFKLFVFEGKDGNYIRQKHWHRSVEIFALFEGELTFYINEREYPLRPGEFMLVNSNEVHSVFSPKVNRTIVLQIPLSTFENYYTDERFIYFTHSSRIQDAEVMEIIGDMYRTYTERDCGYELKVQSQFYMLVYLLVTKYRKTQVSPEVVRRGKKLNHLSAITDYMRKNYNKDLSLENLARTFGYSPTYLSRMFRKYARTNYKAFLNDIRLEHGLEQMEGTDLSIGEIAVRCGFPNSKAFAKVFREKYGILPSQFRKEDEGKNEKTFGS